MGVGQVVNRGFVRTNAGSLILNTRIQRLYPRTNARFKIVVGRARIERATNGLKVRCSTELS
jgi:hypothetical protein